MKKAIALALSLIVAAGVFTGCGSSGESQETASLTPPESTEAAADPTEAAAAESPAAETPSEAPAEIPVEEPAGEPLEIEWLGYQPLAQPSETGAVVKAVEEKYNVKFNFWFLDNAKYEEMLGVRLAGGEMPDVFRIPNFSALPRYVDQGIVAEITDEMLAKAPNYTASMEEWDQDDNAWIDAKIDGKLYGLKNVTLSGMYPTTLAWRTDWLKNVGIDKIPETIEEFETAMYAFANDDPRGDGQKTYGMSETAMGAVFGAFGAVPINRFNLQGGIDTYKTKVDGQVTYSCLQPAMKDALALLQKWYADGLIDPEFVMGENSSGHWATSQPFENGLIGVTGNAMLYHWNPPLWEGGNGGVVYTSYTTVNPDQKFGVNIDLGKQLSSANYAGGLDRWGGVANGGTSISTAAAADSAKVDFIFRLLDDAYGDLDFATMLKFGMEGTHYEISPEGIYSMLPDYATAEAPVIEGIGVFNVSGGGNTSFEKDWNPAIYEFSDKYEALPSVNERAPIVPAQQQYLTDLHTFTVETYMKIIVGEEPVDYFDEYVQQAMDMGFAEIIQQMNGELAKING